MCAHSPQWSQSTRKTILEAIGGFLSLHRMQTVSLSSLSAGLSPLYLSGARTECVPRLVDSRPRGVHPHSRVSTFLPSYLFTGSLSPAFSSPLTLFSSFLAVILSGPSSSLSPSSASVSSLPPPFPFCLSPLSSQHTCTHWK